MGLIQQLLAWVAITEIWDGVAVGVSHASLKSKQNHNQVWFLTFQWGFHLKNDLEKSKD